MVDVLKGLINLLKSNSTLQALLSDRIFGLQLPASQNANMPRTAVVLKYAGGMEAESYAELTKIRIDCFCYGETPFEASKLFLALHTAMKTIARSVFSNVLIHNAVKSAGPLWMIDPDTGWPLVIETWLVCASEISAA